MRDPNAPVAVDEGAARPMLPLGSECSVAVFFFPGLVSECSVATLFEEGRTNAMHAERQEARSKRGQQSKSDYVLLCFSQTWGTFELQI